MTLKMCELELDSKRALVDSVLCWLVGKCICDQKKRAESIKKRFWNLAGEENERFNGCSHFKAWNREKEKEKRCKLCKAEQNFEPGC